MIEKVNLVKRCNMIVLSFRFDNKLCILVFTEKNDSDFEYNMLFRKDHYDSDFKICKKLFKQYKIKYQTYSSGAYLQYNQIDVNKKDIDRLLTTLKIQYGA